MRPQVIRRAASAAVALSVLAGLMPTATLAGAPPTIEAFLGICVIRGHGTPSGQLTLHWVNQAGFLKRHLVLTAAASGDWFTPNCAFTTVEIGDSITATSNDGSHTLVVPRLTVGTDRVADTVFGKAPAGASLTIDLHNACLPSPCPDLSATVVANGAGSYSKDFTADTNVLGGARAKVTWGNPSGDRVTAFVWAAKLQVEIGDLAFSGLAQPETVVHVTLKNSSGQVRGTGVAMMDPASDRYSGKLRNANGLPVYPRAGERIVSDIASDASFKLPAIIVTGDAATDHISGHCMANRPVIAAVRTSSSFATKVGTSDGTGHFDVDFSGFVPFAAGDRVTVICFRVTGDTISRSTGAV